MIVRFKKVARGESFLWNGHVWKVPNTQIGNFMNFHQLRAESKVFVVKYSEEPLEKGCLVHHHHYLLALYEKKATLSNLLLLRMTSMKTLEQVLELYKTQCLDNRDLTRLMIFVKTEDLPKYGYGVAEGQTRDCIPYTHENVLKQLEVDVAFGFEKALDQRGISASFMYAVVKMWNWILEEGLEDFKEYTQYGLPVFKKTAVKYGFKDMIPGYEGNESKFAAGGME